MTSKIELQCHQVPYYRDILLDDRGRVLTRALHSGDGRQVAHVLGVLARAYGMSQIAREAGIRREPLYRSLSADGDPRLSTILGVIRALGLRLSAGHDDD